MNRQSWIGSPEHRAYCALEARVRRNVTWGGRIVTLMALVLVVLSGIGR